MNTQMKSFRPIMSTFPSMFDGVFADSPHYFKDEKNSNFPAVDVVETVNDFKIELAAPGLKKEQIKVNVDNQTLTISSEKKVLEGEKTEN